MLAEYRAKHNTNIRSCQWKQ